MLMLRGTATRFTARLLHYQELIPDPLFTIPAVIDPPSNSAVQPAAMRELAGRRLKEAAQCLR